MPELDDDESRLEEILAEYVRRAESGMPINPDALVAQNPDLADELRSFFRNRAAMQNLAAPLREADVATLGLSIQAPPAAGHVRYFGDYELLDEIARGGMGVVYRARQDSLNRVVALKMILSGQLASGADVRRFRQEAEAAANLDNPHIVPIYEIGEHQGQHYFSMKLIDGPSLAEILRSQPSVREPRTAVRLLETVARAVHHAHQRGVLHRDLKPGNILLDAVGNPHITDFGLATRVEADSDLTQSGAILGTPSYMAPEQARAEKLTTAADVYSLGAILFELLTGEPPFKGDTAAATLLKVLSSESPSPRSLNATVDRDLDTICSRCLEHEPGRRYDSAAALADDLARWLRGQPILARRISSWERAVKWSRRHPARAAMVAISVVSAAALFTAVAVGNYLIRGEQQRTLLEKKNTDAANTSLRRERAQTLAALDRLKHVAYGQSLSLVQSEYQANNIARAERLLRQTPAELRHWEWDYLNKVLHGELRSVEAPQANLRSIALRPDGEALAAGGGATGFGPFLGTQSLYFFDANYQGQPPFHDEPPHGAIMDVEWSPFGDRVALALWCMTDARDVVLSGSKIDPEYAGRIDIWDVRQRKRLHSLKEHHSFVHEVAWSADGALVASASSDQTANVWNAATGERKVQLKGHQGQVMCVAFDPQNRWIATGSQGPLTDFGSSTPNDFGELKLWTIDSGKEIRSLAGHELGILALACSPDGSVLASASRDGTIRLWNTADGELIRTLFGHAAPVTCVAWTADGERIVSGSEDRTVRLWSAVDGKPLAILRGHTLPVRSIAVHSARNRVISCAEDHGSARPEIKVWDLQATPEVVVCRGLAQEVRKMALSHDGRLVASAVSKPGGQYHEVRVFDALTGARLATLEGDDGYPHELCFRTDGKLVALYGYEKIDVKTFDVAVGRADHFSSYSIKQYETKDNSYLRGVGPALAHDGSLLATYDEERQEVVVSDIAAGREYWRAPHASKNNVDLLWSDNLRVLVAVNSDRMLEKGEPGRWRTTAVRAWNIIEKRQVFAATPVSFYGWRYAVTNDGSRLAIVGDQRGLALWDLRSGKEIPVPELSDVECRYVEFSPDGSQLVTVHQDGSQLSMQIRSLADGGLTATLTDFSLDHPGGYYGGDVEFTADGRRFFTSGDGTVKVWDAKQGTLLLTFQQALLPMTISRDTRTIAAAGPHGVTQVWTAGEMRP